MVKVVHCLHGEANVLFVLIRRKGSGPCQLVSLRCAVGVVAAGDDEVVSAGEKPIGLLEFIRITQCVTFVFCHA